MPYQGWKIGTHEYCVAFAADKLVVMKTEFGRTRRFEWSKNEIANIKVAASRLESNDEPVMEYRFSEPRGNSTDC